MLETSIKRHSPEYESRVWLIIACCLVFLTTQVSGACLVWKFGQYLWMERRVRARKKLTEEIVETRLKKFSSLVEARSKALDKSSRKRMPQKAKEVEVVEVGTGAAAEAIIKEDDELHKAKGLIPTEKRYVNREVQVRLETGKETKSNCDDEFFEFKVYFTRFIFRKLY